ncbi:substrate-binding domain-containing protein, partial [Blautia faecis]|uniref:substrate-binding domain-containing protein n=1 Tax=Blautia faecis TaxID=871665 RepID=UPI001D0176A3
ISTRKSGFIKYCQYFGLKYTELLLENELTSEAGYNLIHNLAKTKELPTAIFAVNDPIAIGAMRALQDQGIRVP